MKQASQPKLSILIPCRNEAQGIGSTIINARQAFESHSHEIIVSDSSHDNSFKIAQSMGAKVIRHTKKGYGNAYHQIIPEAKGDYIIMADADGSYDFRDAVKMIDLMDRGYDLVLGNRFFYQKNIQNMPFIRWFIGNPLLTTIMNVLFALKISDSQCGLRAMRLEAFKKAACQSGGMEFASELIIRFHKQGFKITETPIQYLPRFGKSKLSPIRDGLRHLRLMFKLRPGTSVCEEVKPSSILEPLQTPI